MNKILSHPQCRLVTTLIVYHLPDFPGLVNEFLIQNYDLVPELPLLHNFLEFWEHNIDGPVKLVRVTYPGIKIPRSVHFVDSEHTLH